MTFVGTVDGAATRLALTDDDQLTLTSVTHGVTWVDVPAALVLDAHCDACTVTWSFLSPRTRPYRAALGQRVWPTYPYTHYRLARDAWRTRDASALAAPLHCTTLTASLATPADAERLCAALLAAAYPHSAPHRRVLVVCNPVSGRGRGRAALDDAVRPILRAAGCAVEVVLLAQRFDALRQLATRDLHAVDALVVVGGDGTMHEVLNALAARADAADALRTPLVPVPAGSGNALYINLHGDGHGASAPLACLSAIKGTPYAHELCVVTQPAALFAAPPYPLVHTDAHGSYVQYYAFLSVALGVLADVDLGTEWMRALGDARFTLGYLAGVWRNAACDVDVDVCLGAQGTVDRAAARATHAAPRTPRAPHTLAHGSVLAPLVRTAAPITVAADACALQCAAAPHDAWRALDVPVSTLYVGKLPYASRAFMPFPYASPDDGTLDVTLQNQATSIPTKLASMQESVHGDHIHAPGMHYLKAEAVRVTPRHTAPGTHFVSVDGESLPYGPLQIEVAPLAAHFLALRDAHWQPPALARPAVARHAASHGS